MNYIKEAEKFLIQNGCQRMNCDGEDCDFFEDVQPKDLLKFAEIYHNIKTMEDFSKKIGENSSIINPLDFGLGEPNRHLKQNNISASILKEIFNVEVKYTFFHVGAWDMEAKREVVELEELADVPFFVTINEAFQWLHEANKDGHMDGYCLELKTLYFPNCA